jgi:hypothetical protein
MSDSSGPPAAVHLQNTFAPSLLHLKTKISSQKVTHSSPLLSSPLLSSSSLFSAVNNHSSLWARGFATCNPSYIYAHFSSQEDPWRRNNSNNNNNKSIWSTEDAPQFAKEITKDNENKTWFSILS